MGQINPDSSMGHMLEILGSDDTYSTYVDVGTWNGLGTTRCIMNGIERRTAPAEVWSYEANATMYQTAIQNWQMRPPSLHLINGTLHREIADLDAIHGHPAIARMRETSGDEYKQWYVGELASLMSAPIVSPPSHVDVVVLDGGEFTTGGDWDILKTRSPRVVVLDDTSAFKTYDIREELLQSSDWEVVCDIPNERNGWAIFKRVDVFHDE